jgi:hypothetical protein
VARPTPLLRGRGRRRLRHDHRRAGWRGLLLHDQIRRRPFARDGRAPPPPVPAPHAVAQRAGRNAVLGADVLDRPVGVLVVVADLRPGVGGEGRHGRSLACRRMRCPILRSSPRKRGPRGQGFRASGCWIPAFAGMSGEFGERVAQEPAAAIAKRRLAARASVGGCPTASRAASRCQGIYSARPRPGLVLTLMAISPDAEVRSIFLNTGGWCSAFRGYDFRLPAPANLKAITLAVTVVSSDDNAEFATRAREPRQWATISV